MDTIDISDISDISEESNEYISRGEPLPEQIQQNINNISQRIESQLKQTNPGKSLTFGALVENGGLVWSIGDGISRTENITIENSSKEKVNLGDAIKDPTIPTEDIVNSYKSSCEKIGLSLEDSNLSQMNDAISNDPSRKITEYSDNISSKAKSTEMKNLNSSIKEQTGFDLSDTTNKKPSNINELNNAIKSDPTIKDLQSKINDLQEKLKDPENESKLEKSKSNALDWVKFAAFVAAGILTYEALLAYQHSLQGCWQAVSDGKSCTKGKIYALTCDSCCNNTGTEGTLGTVCDPANQLSPPPCKCPDPPCIHPIGCACGSNCTNESSLCSKWCDNSTRITKDSEGHSYAYTCQNPSLLDAISDIANNVENAISDLAGDVTSFLKNLLKYGLIVLLIIGGLILLYIAYKFISPLFNKHKASSKTYTETPDLSSFY